MMRRTIHEVTDPDRKALVTSRETVRRDCEKQARHTDQSPEELMEQAQETARLMSEKVDL
ncbi:MAG: hypothetical protein ABEJ65_00535 [bacterium]